MPRIVVGLSGGVDSALAAALLQERGWDVIGCFLKVELQATSHKLQAPCPWVEDLPMAHRVAARLNIPLIVKDVSAGYMREVLEPMIAAYRRGETPNPDTTCNRYVKFDALIAVAREVGAEQIATGHYARLTRGKTSGVARGRTPDFEEPRRPSGREKSGVEERAGAEEREIELYRALDHVKDQSYFLWMLMREQLSWCEFPLGEWRKGNVRQEAKRRGFPNWDRESTSGVCFLGQVNLSEFLQQCHPEPQRRISHSGREILRSTTPQNDTSTEVTVLTTTGQVLGTIPHPEALTIGQRVPLAGQSTPHYVVAQGERHVIVAAPDDPARYTKMITTGPPHWIGEPPQFSPPLSEGERLPAEALAKAGEGVRTLRCSARIRHRQEPIPCTVTLHSPLSTLNIQFDTPLTGVAPGQAVVFTDGDRILGGAQILKPKTFSHSAECENVGPTK
jgi:tRNA-specific 2-thiouridylase